MHRFVKKHALLNNINPREDFMIVKRSALYRSALTALPGLGVVAGLALTLTCVKTTGPDAGGTIDVRNAPYGTWGALTQTVHKGNFGSANQGSSIKLGLVAADDRVFNGVSASKYRLGFVTSPGQPVDSITGSRDDIWATFKGSEVSIYGAQGGGLVASVIPLLSGMSGNEVILDSPIVFDPAAMSVGETKTGTIGATIAGTTRLNVNVTYSLTSDAATAVTGSGPIAGCRQYHLTASPSDAWIRLILGDNPIEGDGWYHPQFGIVAVSVPALGIESGMSQQEDYGTDAEEGHNVIKMTKVITSTDQTFELSTANRHGNWDADKNTHAQMLLELRWADTVDAKTLAEPHYLMYPILFSTAIGVFSQGDSRWGSVLTESPVSIFHPQENGKGYRYWYCFVNQAAKNEAGSAGILYKINVRNDGGRALRCTARIGYLILPPAQR
jgi:hypothetical protein